MRARDTSLRSGKRAHPRRGNYVVAGQMMEELIMDEDTQARLRWYRLMLIAIDVEKNAERHFAMKDITSWMND